MSIDLKGLSLKELQKLAKDVAKAIDTVEARQRKEARAAMEKLAKEYGVSIEDILGAETKKPARKKRAQKPKAGSPKYQNPADPSQTWTGKGRRPQWYLDAMKAGKTDDDLMIAPQ